MQSGHYQIYADQFPGAFNFICIQFPHSFLQFLIGWFSEATNISSEIADVPSAHGGDNLQQLIIFMEVWPQDLAEHKGLYHPDFAGQHRGRIRWWLHNAEVSAQVHRAALWNTFHLSHEPKLFVWDWFCSTGLFEVGRQLPKDSSGVSGKTNSSRGSWLEWLAKSSHAACKGETNLIFFPSYSAIILKKGCTCPGFVPPKNQNLFLWVCHMKRKKITG